MNPPPSPPAPPMAPDPAEPALPLELPLAASPPIPEFPLPADCVVFVPGSPQAATKAAAPQNNPQSRKSRNLVVRRIVTPHARLLRRAPVRQDVKIILEMSGENWKIKNSLFFVILRGSLAKRRLRYVRCARAALEGWRHNSQTHRCRAQLVAPIAIDAQHRFR